MQQIMEIRAAIKRAMGGQRRMGAVRTRAMVEKIPDEDKFLPYALDSAAHSLTLY
jgi:hypothetical protein